MPDNSKPNSSLLDWEARQKLASFHQTRLTAVQHGAVSALASIAIVFSLIGLVMNGTSDIQVKPAMVIVAVSAWLMLGLWLRASFARSARRVQSEYDAEHRAYFPDTDPYRLESFLLARVRRA